MLFAFTACGGIARGKSAYEIALDNGFVGTEQQWLESLKGQNGANGLDGADGKDGVNFNPDYTATALYQEMVANGQFEGTFEEFIIKYFAGNENGNNDAVDDVTAINTSLRSTVSIVCAYTKSSGEVGYSAGAGVIYSLDKEAGDAIIITNFHVVYAENAKNSTGIVDEIVAMPYGSGYTTSPFAFVCTFVGGSATYDLAVLIVKGSDAIKNNDMLLSATVADSTYVSVGQTVYAVGNPEGAGISASKGVLSVDSEYVDMEDVYGSAVSMRLMRYDASVSPGNSGGGLFSANGELIGIVNAKSIADKVEGVNYAIPSFIVKTVVTQILNQCLDKVAVKFSKPLLGITVEEHNIKGVYNQSTGALTIEAQIIVAEITSTSIAKGVLMVGDRIMSVTHGGKTYNVCRNHHVVDVILGAYTGDEVSFLVIRNGIEQTVSLTVTANSLTLIQ